MRYWLILSFFVFLALSCSAWYGKSAAVILLMIYQIKYKRFTKGQLALAALIVLWSLSPYTFRNNCFIETHDHYAIAAINHQKVLIYTDEMFFENEGVISKEKSQSLSSLSNFHFFDFKKYLNDCHVNSYLNQKDVLIQKKQTFARSLYEKIENLDDEIRNFLNQVFYQSGEDDLIFSSGLHLSALNQLMLSVLLLYFNNKLAYGLTSGFLLWISMLFPSQFALKRLLLGNLIRMFFTNSSRKEQTGLQYLLCMAADPFCVKKAGFLIPYFLSIIQLFNHSKITSILFLMFYQFAQYGKCSVLYLLCFSWVRRFDLFVFVCSLIFVVCPLVPLSVLARFTNMFSLFMNSIVLYGKPPILFSVLFLLFFLYSIEKRKSQAAAWIIVLLIPFQAYFNPYYEVVMINVGQGDSFLIRSPFNRGNILLDIPVNQEKRVVDYLHSIGIHRIDVLVLSHDDSDHNGGKERLKELIQVNEIIEEARDITLSGIQMISINTTNHEDDNDNSLVYYAKIGTLKYLFMGDASKQIEKELLKQYDLHCDVLKVGHHGSKTSTDPLFIQHTQPKIAFISVKEKNRYGHPDANVLKILENYHVKTYLSAYDGAVSIKSFLNFNFITTSNGEFGIMIKE